MSSATNRPSSLVLVVDDDAVSRIMLRRSLELYGYQVIEADDGEQCLSIVSQQMPDLIVLDGVMPRMDGFTVLSRLRAEDRTRAVPILMLTALQDVAYKVRGFELGADDFLNKPIDRVELVARVRALLRLKQYHDELEQKNVLLRQALSRYVVEDVANELLSHKQSNLYVSGQSSRVSVLFADIRGFPGYMPGHDAQAVIRLINTIFARLVPVVFAHRGTFNKTMSEAFAAFFGAPVPYPDDALRAVQSAVQMQSAFAALQDEQPELKSFSLGIGVYTGDAVVGYVGSDQAMDYTILGVPPNAARGLAEFAGSGQILLDQNTAGLLGSRAVIESAPPLVMQRKGEPGTVESVRLVSLPGDAAQAKS
ncbi:MAG: response regulator [Chloroflexi bacterium]|nr:response regulator [Chloroflexota bacterium]